MLMLSLFQKLNNQIFKFFIRLFYSSSSLQDCLSHFYYIQSFLGGSIMDKYFNSYREMISLRGLADHTLKSYCTYIRSYLDYLFHILHKQPEDVSWSE